MAWLSVTTYVTTSTPVLATVLNNIGLDLRTWGGNVDAGTYTLANVALNANTAKVGTSTGLGTLLTVCSGTINTAADAQGIVSLVSADPGSPFGAVTIHASDALAANKGGSIAFAARYITSSTAAANMALIRGCKNSATSGELVGYLSFHVRNTAMTEIARVTPAGFGINTTAPTSKLHVAGLSTYASNALAISAGLTAGAFYTDGSGNVKVVF